MENIDTKRLMNTVVLVKQWLGKDCIPQAAVVLGSGLGGFATGSTRSISYQELGFPSPSVEGHAGRLHLKKIEGRDVLLLSGRVHAYEGHSLADVVFAVRTLAAAGLKTFVITCASGGVNPNLNPGDLVIITDHLNLTFVSPLRGPNVDGLGPRFPDMTYAYDKELQQLALAAAVDLWGMMSEEIHHGVYAMMPGPQYETPAEVRMLRTLGADLAGMSTVPEVIALKHMGARVLGLSCVTNHAAGVKDQPLAHAEVVETAAKTSQRFAQLLTAIIARLP